MGFGGPGNTLHISDFSLHVLDRILHVLGIYTTILTMKINKKYRVIHSSACDWSLRSRGMGPGDPIGKHGFIGRAILNPALRNRKG